MGIFTRPDGIKKTAIDARATVRRGSVETPYVKSYAARFHTGYDQLEPPSEGSLPHPADSISASHGARWATELVSVFFLLLVGMNADTFTTVLFLAALTSMAAPNSKAHFSPAITFMYWVRGDVGAAEGLSYAIHQLVGATLGALTNAAIFGLPEADHGIDGYAELAGFGVRLLVPSLLVGITHLAVISGDSRTQFFGVAFGFAVFAATTAFGAGASLFNPALSLGSWLARGLLGGGFNVADLGAASSSSLVAEAALFAFEAAAVALAVPLYRLCSADDQKSNLLVEMLGAAGLTSLLIATAGAPAAARAQAVGLGYVALTYAGAEQTEAHYNPAVTLCHYLVGSVDGTRAIGYALAQLLGACAAAVALAVSSAAAVAESAAASTAAAPLSALALPALVELLLGAFTLCLVHAHVLAAQPDNGFFGLAVGFAPLLTLTLTQLEPPPRPEPEPSPEP